MRIGRTRRLGIVMAGVLSIASTFTVAGAAVRSDPAPIWPPELVFWFGEVGNVGDLDARGDRIAVTDTFNDMVHVFDVDGVFQHDLGGPGAGPGQFDQPNGVGLAASGRVYVSDSSLDRVSAFSPAGTHLFDFGSAGSGPGLLNIPTDVAVVGGKVYVADYGNSRIQEFDNDGSFLRSFSHTDLGLSGFLPLSVVPTMNGHLAVRYGAQGESFALITTDGEVVGEIDTDGLGEIGVVDDQGRIWLAAADGLIKIKDIDNNLLGEWQAFSKRIAFKPDGNLLVFREVFSRINVYKFYECNNRLATYVGTPGDDFVTGSPLDDVAVLRGGDDFFSGGLGRDTICGGPGADTLDGGGGIDRVYGQGGPDLIYGQSAKDFLFGGNGLDTIFGGGGPDWIYGGKHADELRGGNGNDSIFGGNGPDDCYGGPGTDEAASCATQASIP